MKSQLLAAERGGYAVPAFNVSNLELSRAIIETADETESPVIVQVHPVELDYAGVGPLTALLRAMCEETRVPVVLHLDHGDSFDRVKEAVSHSFTSVMFDGAHLSFEENVRESRRVVEFCRSSNVSVEAELGVLGGSGQEVHDGNATGGLTDPKAAMEFVRRTEIDTLAIAVGNEHGLYTGPGVRSIDVDRIKDIFDLVKIPLVLHGGSDTPDETVKLAIRNGIRKVNISTDMKVAFRKAILDFMTRSDEHEPHVINEHGIAAAKVVIRQKMEAFGCLGAANDKAAFETG